MTTIDFYTHCANRYEVAATLVAKAWSQHGSARVLTPDVVATDEFDRFLWTWPALGFVPHCRMDDPIASETPVWIDERLEHSGPAAVLLNLHRDPPPFFSRFERLAEVVAADEANVVAGRARFRFYRERGYEMRQHDWSQRD